MAKTKISEENLTPEVAEVIREKDEAIEMLTKQIDIAKESKRKNITLIRYNGKIYQFIGGSINIRGVKYGKRDLEANVPIEIRDADGTVRTVGIMEYLIERKSGILKEVS
jgi:hypothetical protein